MSGCDHVIEVKAYFAVYITCPCNLDLWIIYIEIAPRDQDHVLKVGLLAYFKFFRYVAMNLRFVARYQTTGVAMAIVLSPTG